MKIDVVYKLGKKCEWNDYGELRYSLRSLRNFIDLGKVFIVGVKPDWIKNVIHLCCEDRYKSNKDANLIEKLILACSHSQLTPLFINMSDDYFFIEKTSFLDIQTPLTHSTPLYNISQKDNSKWNKWEKRIDNTIKVLKERGFKGGLFESHTPTLLNKEKFPEIISKYNYKEGFGLLGNTLYFNTIGVVGREVEERDRMRVNNNGVFKETGSRFLSIGGKTVEESDCAKWIKNRFNEKSIYEL